MKDDPVIEVMARLLLAMSEAVEAYPKVVADLLVLQCNQLRAGMPEAAPLTTHEAEAEEWANAAHVGELEAYGAACLSRIGDRALNLTARKRLLWLLWQTLPEGDRTAFLNKVMGDG